MRESHHAGGRGLSGTVDGGGRNTVDYVAGTLNGARIIFKDKPIFLDGMRDLRRQGEGMRQVKGNGGMKQK